MNLNNDNHLDVCQNIEVGLCEQYRAFSNLTDSQCIFALENAKIAVKQEFGHAKNEKVTDMPEAQGIIEWCVSIGKERIGKINDLTLKEYITLLDKIRRSVKRHSTSGRRGYYEFIRQYV